MLNLIGEGLAKGAKKALQETAEDVGEKAASKVAKKAAKKVIPVSYIDDAAEIVVGKPKMMDIYRGMSSETTDDMKKYLSDMVDAKIRPRTYGSEAKYGEGYYFGNFGDARGYADRNTDDNVRAILKTDVPTNRFITISEKNRNRPEDFYNRALKRAMGADEETVKKQALADIDRYLQKNGLLGFRTPKEKYFDPYYVIAKNDPAWMDNLTVESAIKDGSYDRNTKPDDVLKNELNSVINHPSELSSLLSPEIAQQDRLSTPYLMSVKPDFEPDYDTRMTIDKLANSVKRIGSDDVAKVDKKTLPVGWKELEKRMDLSYMDDKIAKLAGKEKFRDVTLPDMKKILDDMGYGVDPELLKLDGEQIATYNALKDAIDDELATEISNKGGKAAPEFLRGRSGAARGRYAEPENFYLDHQGRAGYLDAELSDRLGIGLSNTPLSDDLNNYTSRDAAGDYFATGIGLKPSEMLRGERELSTMAHERLHSFQNTAGDYAPEVGQAYNELHEALAPYKLNKKQIKDYHGKLGHGDPDYYLNDHEQEARMWQEYLDRAGYTKAEENTSKVRRKFLAGRSEEFDPGIDKAFDQFLLKLRTLSKAGVALPAVGLALLLGENYNNKKKEG